MRVNIIKEYFSSWEMIRDGIDKCNDPKLALPLICTALDYVAMKNNMSTFELLQVRARNPWRHEVVSVGSV